MGVKFSLNYNTATDWLKAGAAAVAAAGAAFASSKVDGSVGLADWVTIVVSTVVAFGASLGLYHSNDATYNAGSTKPAELTTSPANYVAPIIVENAAEPAPEAPLS